MIKVKDEAKKIVDKLPDQATWDDLMYELYVRQKIEEGLNDVKNNNVISHDEMKKRFLFSNK